MAVVRDQPYGSARFIVEIEGMQPLSFIEALLPELTDSVIEYREGTEKETASRKLAGRPRFGSLILKRGFNGSLELYEWWKAAADGNQQVQRTVVVYLQDEAASTVVATWRLKGAWPTRYFFSPLLANGHEVLVETTEIACQRMDME